VHEQIEQAIRVYIPDFTRWRQHDAFEGAFTRLLRDHKAVDGPPPPRRPRRRQHLGPAASYHQRTMALPSMIQRPSS
jgi:hypothetical protein